VSSESTRPSVLELPAVTLHPLGTASLRDLFNAPEIERFLARDHVDLTLVDELEALRVRVRRGVEVIENRANAACVAAYQRRNWLLAAAGASAGGLAASFLAFRRTPLAATAMALLLLGLAAVLIHRLLRVRRDLRLLLGLRGRYRRAIERPGDIPSLLELSQRIYKEACHVGGRDCR
jgi:hypothetical protein